MRRTLTLLLAALVLPATPLPAAADSDTPPAAAISSAHPAATRAGMTVLEQGGNAFDAAVAVSAALAVVEPQGSGLGGGGFWLLHEADSGRDIMVDGREKAPNAASRDMYLDDSGEFIEDASRDGALAAGIPGEPAALVHMASKYGALDLATSLAPAIRLAREGFPVGEHMHRLAEYRRDVLARYPASAALILDDDDQPLPVGTTLRQPDLARTLEILAREGRAGFYDGDVARRLVEAVQSAGGIWTRQDLADYEVVEREPIRGRYKTPQGRYEIVSAGPPSSGGPVLVEALNIIEGFDWAGLDDVQRRHITIEAMRRAYRDRAVYLGDPDFVDMPIARLTDKRYAAGLRVGIRRDRATRSNELARVTADHANGRHTTHFSVIDAEGNRVAATLSVNFPFGSGMVAAGTGVFLNDEMDDFAAKPLTPNGYGLVSSEANAIAPGKRPLSSMTPTFVVGDDRTLALGTPGGSRIISMVLLGVLDFTHGGDAESVVSTPRYHHQYLPDAVEYETGALSADTIDGLEALGHRLKRVDRRYGDMHAVIWDRVDDRVDAAADPRGIGCAAIGQESPVCASAD
ncbi:gamma-glutamyltransferase [Salinisphaera orenii MK-B5]|uniref:Glutathione hydrolase proenzyme n=1 Tax=Salinisphaera orenii MK-B5 TaxID=856730 RepID=A0A423PW82_9GAMM|nr:gamma-glutamyltransferase [Salinisphaera orenii]ROO29867.1 gamma-glutamyltransferase [Salinisphaera orenii MK-B5]